MQLQTREFSTGGGNRADTRVFSPVVIFLLLSSAHFKSRICISNRHKASQIYTLRTRLAQAAEPVELHVVHGQSSSRTWSACSKSSSGVSLLSPHCGTSRGKHRERTGDSPAETPECAAVSWGLIYKSQQRLPMEGLAPSPALSGTTRLELFLSEVSRTERVRSSLRSGGSGIPFSGEFCHSHRTLSVLREVQTDLGTTQ